MELNRVGEPIPHHETRNRHCCVWPNGRLQDRRGGAAAHDIQRQVDRQHLADDTVRATCDIPPIGIRVVDLIGSTNRGPFVQIHFKGVLGAPTRAQNFVDGRGDADTRYLGRRIRDALVRRVLTKRQVALETRSHIALHIHRAATAQIRAIALTARTHCRRRRSITGTASAHRVLGLARRGGVAELRRRVASLVGQITRAGHGGLTRIGRCIAHLTTRAIRVDRAATD